MAVADDLPRLECGRTTEDVWTGITRPPDDHERSCAYCQQARSDLNRLQEAIDSEHQLAGAETDEPSGSVKKSIMDIARHELRQGRRIPLEQTATSTDREPGLAISERALTELVLGAADDIASVRGRRVRITIEPGAIEPGTTDSGTTDSGIMTGDSRAADQRVSSSGEGLPATIAIMVTVSVRLGVQMPRIVATLRERIAGIVTDRVGVEVDRVDISVEDVHED